MTTKSITLVSCSGKKRRTAAPARDLYLSGLFKKSAAWAERQGDEWFVLSAEHGVIRTDAKIAPYDVSLTTMDPYSRQLWANAVAEQLERMALTWGVDHLRVTLLAGSLYASWIPVAGDLCTVNQPLKGMQIGQRLHWLTVQLAQDELSLEQAA